MGTAANAIYRFFSFVVMLILSLSINSILASASTIEPVDVMLARTYTDQLGTVLNYRIYIPDNYVSTNKYKLLLYLHGAGSRGSDNTAHITTAANGIMKRIINDPERKQDCIIIAPQCPANMQWVNTPWANGSYSVDNVPKSQLMIAVESLLGKVQNDYSIDKTRIYVTGVSMGGFGTWDIIMRNPNMFAAAIPVCGSADPSKASNIKDLPIWTFHGTQDTTVPVQGTRDMFAALQNVGSDVKYTEYPTIGHDAWLNAYAETDLLTWLFSQQLSGSNFTITCVGSTLNIASESDQDATIIISSYDSINKLLDVMMFENEHLNANEEKIFDVSGLFTKNSAKIQITLWDNSNNIKPLCPVKLWNEAIITVENTGEVTVKASAEGGSEKQCIILVEDSNKNIIYIDQMTSDLNGQCLYNFALPVINGVYKVRIGEENTQAKSYTFILNSSN